MWYEKLDNDEKRMVAILAGMLRLPELNKYQSLHHFLNDVYSRLIEARSLNRQALKYLGE